MIQPKVTELILDSGIKVHVSPLSRYQRNALNEKAEALYPYPDKALYEETLPEDIAIPGFNLPAEDNKAYQAAVLIAGRGRADHINTALLNICLAFPDYPNRG